MAGSERDWGFAARATAIGLVVVAVVLIGWALQGVLTRRHPEERVRQSPAATRPHPKQHRASHHHRHKATG